MSKVNHGVSGRLNHSCPCDVCVEAGRVYARSLNNKVQAINAASKEGATRKNKAYEPWEIDALHSDMTTQELAKLLKRSFRSITGIRSRLGIKNKSDKGTYNGLV